ncbi:hypothetical protein P7K49_033495 [Saguinus oedipus]|uniref:small monomeric GTPase n=1 Tax=Saguinus oedipus TaxID=9490 RepID=A0ABQ9TS27_SAGOE|nr:hypothetical protein P7K49_033495 [Saguinus oedipus]
MAGLWGATEVGRVAATGLAVRRVLGSAPFSCAAGASPPESAADETPMSPLPAQGIMLVYDITNEKSFDNIRNWIRNIEEHASADVEKMILGNKCDVNDKRQVSKERGEKVGMVAQGAEGVGGLGIPMQRPSPSLCCPRGSPECSRVEKLGFGGSFYKHILLWLAWDELVTPLWHVPGDSRVGSTRPAGASRVSSLGVSSKPTMAPLQAFKATGAGDGAVV